MTDITSGNFNVSIICPMFTYFNEIKDVYFCWYQQVFLWVDRTSPSAVFQPFIIPRMFRELYLRKQGKITRDLCLCFWDRLYPRYNLHKFCQYKACFADIKNWQPGKFILNRLYLVYLRPFQRTDGVFT